MSARPSASHETLLAELAAIYREADALFAEHRCEASTECCRFGITGREPYVTSIELSALRRAVGRLGGRVAKPASKALPIARARDERRCPMLTSEGRCAVYADRPLGCRTFFCDRATAPTKVRHREVQELVRRVQAVAAKHEPDGDKGRPLTRAIAEKQR